jgi:hypothetical protein
MGLRSTWLETALSAAQPGAKQLRHSAGRAEPAPAHRGRWLSAKLMDDHSLCFDGLTSGQGRFFLFFGFFFFSKKRPKQLLSYHCSELVWLCSNKTLCTGNLGLGLTFFFFLAALVIEPRVSHMLSSSLSLEPCPQSFFFLGTGV